MPSTESSPPGVPSTSSDGPPASSIPPGAVDLDELVGRLFQTIPQEGELATMVFFIDDQRLGATHNCTQMQYPYTIDGVGLRAEINGEPAIACEGFPPRPDASTLIGLLTNGAEVTLDGDELTLTSPKVALTLFDQEVADPDRPLVGTVWQGGTILFGGGGASISSLASVTLVFIEDTVEVDTGCVTATLDVVIADELMSTDPLPGANRVCGESAADLDQALRDVVASRFEWNVRADQLTLSRADLDADTAAAGVAVGIQLVGRPADACPEVAPFFTTPTPESVPSPSDVPAGLDPSGMDEFVKSAIGPVVKAMNLDDATTLLIAAGWTVTVGGTTATTATAPIRRAALILTECAGIVIEVGLAQ